MVRHQIRRNGVHIIGGTARFVDSKVGEKIKLAVLLTDPDGEKKGIYKHRYVIYLSMYLFIYPSIYLCVMQLG